ncbi:MAG: HAMP domain-containing protein [Chitinispirillaceae bacterium]|nr:HAMP domain-containing protein [Chitinispirillaceae bacterium]
MKRFVSIRTKLIFNTMLLITAAFSILLSVIIVSNIITVRKNSEKSKTNIRTSLLAKGRTLAQNNSIAMRGMAEDNAFTAIRDLVSSTVADDEDVAYGIYMDRQIIPWVYATPDNPKGIPRSNNPLDDSISRWAGSLERPAFIEYAGGRTAIIEFAAPVFIDDKILGHIRYGISTNSMERSIREVQADGRATLKLLILIILSTGLFSLIVGYAVVRQLSARITSPIGSLVSSTKSIAEGNYDLAVKQESNDEIGDLAGRFETMRLTIKQYTDHLQDLIDEKMRQVNDILNNIEQGLFTINLDGSVNKEYSARANLILKVKDVAACSIRELLRFDMKQGAAFLLWLDLVRKLHKQQRWIKLAKLAPVQQIELFAAPDTLEKKYIAVSYQPICDKKGDLVKVMVLALDETEKRMKDQQMAAERMQHESEVKAILNIANTPAEEIAEFTEDTSSRLHGLRAEIAGHLYCVRRQRDSHPATPLYSITKEHVDRLFRDLHTIKGNSGSYGFEMLSYFAHEAEDLLEKLREPIQERRDNILHDINGLLDSMDQSLDDIHRKIKLIFGKDEEITVRIPDARINNIVELCKRIESKADDPEVRSLITECIMLSWKPLKTLFRKYQKLAHKTARKVNKNINFIINNETMSYPNDILAGLDDVLIHLIRNAVDHGIEEPGVREEVGKSVGRIQVSLECGDGNRIISVADDGCGIDTDRVVERCIEKNIITREQAGRLTREEKIGLLFKGGISTAATVTDISGRGMGMQIIHNKVVELKGTLSIDSQLGKGTTCTISVPVDKEKPLL